MTDAKPQRAPDRKRRAGANVRSRGKPDVHLTVGQAIIGFLEAQYSRYDGTEQRLIPGLLGIFGHGNVAGLGQGLVEARSALKYYQPFSEQSMVHIATGYAKQMLRRSTLACTSSIGPGATNMVTGAALATINRLPVLLLPADYFASRTRGVVLQQLEHPVSFDTSVNDCFRPVSRFFDRIMRPDQVVESMGEAMRVLTDPAEVGAVTVALPQDVQAESARWPARWFERTVWELERRPPSAAQIREMLQILKGARRPLIVAGGGVIYSGARAQLGEFAALLGAPVAETSAGKGSYTGTLEYLGVGGLGVTGTRVAGMLARNADVVLCVGTRLTDFSTGSGALFQAPNVRLIAINVCPHDAYKMGAVPVVADARVALEHAIQALGEMGHRPRRGYLNEVRVARAAWLDEVERATRWSTGAAVTQPNMLGSVNRAAAPGDTVVTAAGSLPADVLRLWDCSSDRRAHIEFGFSCMGYEIPAAIGARIAQHSGEVYAVIGDGTYLLNPTEILTAAREGLKITVVISNNHGYQCIRDLQVRIAGGVLGTEFRMRNPASGDLDGPLVDFDYAANAETLGARVWSCTTGDDLDAALAEARGETRPCVIVVSTEEHERGPTSGVWWDVGTPEVSTDRVTQRARRTYERSRKAQRSYFRSGDTSLGREA